ncbi:hypothetical protein SETIT_9G359800v2 [Setaria italica]|uniref:Cytochrome P450 n=1 Tax=Setaria italica TaxID=4555 RepID=A0A368SPD2_SETIT|nr:hypothetical protein SETIT_9G359800v2 [Setaria italica]
MDDLSLGSFSLAALAAILLSLLIRCALPARSETSTRLPPGPWNLPIIGSLHHLVGSPPHRALLSLARQHGPLMLLRLGEVPTVIGSSPEAAMEVMKTNDPVFASRPRGAMLDVVSFGGKGIILAPYGEHWRQMRKVCVVELLSARQVRRMERIRQSQLSHLTESIFIAAASASPTIVVNLSQGFTELTNNVISRAVFGGKCQQQQEYLQELSIVTMLVGGFSLDLLDVLLRLQEEDSLTFPLTMEIIGAIIYVNLGDLRYLRMVIKETLRLHPAVPLILRASQENCKIMGYEIPKGTSVFVNTFAVASNPSYWDNAEVFEPERFENSTLDYNWAHFESVPFGAGRRQCPGALFATMTIELTLANLLYHFDWALPDGADPKALDMGEVFGITVRWRSNLCMLPALHLPH